MSEPFSLFSFIGPGHPFLDQVRGFEAAIRAHPGCRDHVLGQTAGPSVVHAEIKALRNAAAGIPRQPSAVEYIALL